MMKTIQPFRAHPGLAMVATLCALVLTTSGAHAQSTAPSFAVLAGTVVTCTDSTITGDVGVFPGTAVVRTRCPVVGTVHAGDAAAGSAYAAFLSAYDHFWNPAPPACNAAHTLTGSLAGQVLLPGTYCIDAVAKAGLLTLNANGDANAEWQFIVNGALTGTGFTVLMINGGQPCNVEWWVKDAATLTDSTFIGTILAGAAITVTRGTFHGDALARAAVTLTGTALTACNSAPAGDHGKHHRKEHHKCNQGVGNGPEACDPGNSNHGSPSNSNDELGGTPGHPGRKP